MPPPARGVLSLPKLVGKAQACPGHTNALQLCLLQPQNLPSSGFPLCLVYRVVPSSCGSKSAGGGGGVTDFQVSEVRTHPQTQGIGAMKIITIMKAGIKCQTWKRSSVL